MICRNTIEKTIINEIAQQIIVVTQNNRKPKFVHGIIKHVITKKVPFQTNVPEH